MAKLLERVLFMGYTPFLRLVALWFFVVPMARALWRFNIDVAKFFDGYRMEEVVVLAAIDFLTVLVGIGFGLLLLLFARDNKPKQ